MTRTAEHEFEQSVRSYELDPYDHLNNGVYVNWYEDARERFIRTKGRHWTWYPANLGLTFVVARIDCEFISPVQARERVLVRTRLARTGTSSVVFRQSIRSLGGPLRSRARVVMAFADDTGRAAPIPDDFHTCFAVSQAGDVWTDDEGGERHG